MREQSDGAIVVRLICVMVQPFMERGAGREGGKKQNHRAEQDGGCLPEHRLVPNFQISAHATDLCGINHPRRAMTSIIIGIIAGAL